jgi:hypothetical protein
MKRKTVCSGYSNLYITTFLFPVLFMFCCYCSDVVIFEKNLSVLTCFSFFIKKSNIWPECTDDGYGAVVKNITTDPLRNPYVTTWIDLIDLVTPCWRGVPSTPRIVGCMEDVV